MKKKYQVIKATTNEIEGVFVGGKRRNFGKNGTFTVSDKGEADEINKVLGARGTGEVVVVGNKEVEHGHNYTFRGVDTSHIKTGKDNGYAWVRIDGKQVRMLKVKALREGYEIIPQKRERRRESAEVNNGIDP